MPIFVPGVERSMAVSVVPLVTCKILSVFFKQGGEREKERKRERERSVVSRILPLVPAENEYSCQVSSLLACHCREGQGSCWFLPDAAYFSSAIV
jgi:hypothetical protein